MRSNAFTRFALLGAVLAAAACGGESSSNTNSSSTPTGGSAGDAGTGGTGATGATGQTGGTGGTGDAGTAGVGPAAGAGGDIGTGGSVTAGAAGEATGGEGGTTPGTQLIGDYLECEVDADCPVGYGDCVTSVPLNVADGSTTEVATQTLFPSLASTGICSRVCTNSPGACSELSLADSRGDTVPYTCQLIYAGTSPYPDPVPSFPFDDQVDAGEMAAGVPFGAICRPPFGLNADVPDEMCDVCNSSAQCGDGVCWDFLTNAEVSAGTGSCMTPCDASGGCPLGFDCTTLDSADYCVPVENTCDGCRDLDGDAVGVGQCAPDGTSTAVDCDDTIAEAYYDDANMTHPFPANCGVIDYNCNGLSDEDEQSGADVYGAEHCGGCDMPCSGQLMTNSVHTGDAACTDVAGVVACRPACLSGYADCDGQLANGCEIEITDPSFIYYPDVDGDGDGDPASPVFACAGQIPPDHVSGNTDCDDGDPDRNGNLPEICDLKDNDCNTVPDDGFNVGVACDGADTDQCQNGTSTCTPDGSGVECVNEVVENIGETCNGADDDCDGSTDEGYAVGDPCDGMDSDDCENGTYTCTANGAGVECVNETVTDITELCNGADDDCDGSTDENWINLGQPCDSLDSDNCANGTWTCNAGGTDVECINESVTDIAEVCAGNNVDEDCDGSIDEGFDQDGDGYYTCIHGNNAPDCNDTPGSGAAIHPNATEVCNNIDDNCVNGVDEGFDVDGDGFKSLARCGIAFGNDCCDTDAGCNPSGGFGAACVGNGCGSFDRNCDGQITERWTSSWSATCIGLGLGCPFTAGWNGGTPGCGGNAIWYNSCDDSVWDCQIGGVWRTQECM